VGRHDLNTSRSSSTIPSDDLAGVPISALIDSRPSSDRSMNERNAAVRRFRVEVVEPEEVNSNLAQLDNGVRIGALLTVYPIESECLVERDGIVQIGAPEDRDCESRCRA
jgi:hypothetical protein